MAKAPNHIPNEIRTNIRRDFVLGKGTISSLSKFYKVNRDQVDKWLHAENWRAVQELFAREDELLVSKAQLVQLNEKISEETEPEAMVQWFKAKGMAFDIFATIAGLPRRPIGKLEKPKSNKLAELMSAASEREEPEQPPINQDSAPIHPVIDVQTVLKPKSDPNSTHS